ncbi:MAG TPA: ATP-binding protein [Polyangiaceae bacterium]|nr:ATP-binding protein [Polyangiaceae bacterium]
MIDPVTAALQRFRVALATVGSRLELGELVLDALRGISTPLRAAAVELDEGGALRVLAVAGLSEAARDLVAAHAPWETPDDSSTETVWVSHLEPDPATLASRAAFAREGIVCVAYVPCRFGERRIGVLALCFDAPRAFSEREAAAVESIAAETALVLEHWRQLAAPVSSLAASSVAERPPAGAPQPLPHGSDELGRQRAALLSDASSLLASSLDPDAALEKLAALVVPALADYAVTYACEGQDVRRLGRVHRNPLRAPLLDALAASGEPNREDRHGPGAVVRTGIPQLEREVSDELLERASLNARHRQALSSLGARSWLMVPLESRGRIIGAFTLATTEDSGRRYDEGDLAFALELGQRVALLVDNARLYREAREAIRMRDDILAVVSHDLRNPLNTIAVASSLLELSPNPEVSRKAQRSIGRAAKQMERLLQDLLDVSRAEAGSLSIERAPVDVSALIEEAFAMALPQAEDKSVQLERRVAGDVGYVDGDRNRLLQVLGNLIGNAIKFVPSGGSVSVGAQHLYGQVRLWISDNGPGIPADHLPRVFDRFWQANRSGSRGAGLGLTIAKSIVDAHGGQIGVHSHEGEGSTFFCWLPCAPGRASLTESPARSEAIESAVPTPQ